MLEQPLAVVHVDDRQHRLPLAERREHEPLVVRRPVAGGGEELEAVEVRVAGRLRELADDFAGRDVGEVHVDREPRPLREEHHALAVGAERRRDVQVAAARLLVGQQPAQTSPAFAWSRRARRRSCCVSACQSLVSVSSSVPRTFSMRLVDVAAGAGGAQHVADGRVAPASGDVRPERMAVAIREEVRIVELLDRRHLLARLTRREPTSPCWRRPDRATGIPPCPR